MPGKAAAQGGPRFHVGELEVALCSRLWPDPALAFVAIWGMNRQTEDLFLSNSALQIKMNKPLKC